MTVISTFITAFAPNVIRLVIEVVVWTFAYLLTILGALVTVWLLRKVKHQQAQVKPIPFDYTGSVLVFLAVSLLTIEIIYSCIFISIIFFNPSKTFIIVLLIFFSNIVHILLLNETV